MKVELTKAQIELLRHALYLLRESTRAQCRLASNEGGEKSNRDADRYGKQIRASLALDDTLGDALV